MKITTANEKRRKICVIGHKNPDTDSICSALVYADLKRKITGNDYTAKRAGQLNEETTYVLNRFGVDSPGLLTSVQLQVKDIEMMDVPGIKDQVSIKTAWSLMKELNIKTLPILRDKKLEGLISVGDIAKSYMDVFDNRALSAARTQYRNIVSALEGKLITGNEHAYFNDGKVAVAASNPDLMEEFIEQGDLVVLGNREEAQQCALDLDVSCIIVSNNAEVSESVRSRADEKSVVVICTPHDTFTAARLINQSIPVKHFMSKENLTTFRPDDYVDDIKGIMAKKRYRDFPVIDKQDNFMGFISRRRLLGARKKQVILVDHNEKSQAVNGIEEAEILEIIDHHRIGSMETIGPVYFRNQPVGCTATIIYQMFQEAGIELDATNASLLCAAILSDTLMFRSPTCTAVDKAAAREMEKLAGIRLEELANNMFRAGSNLKDKTAKEICLQDFKLFTIGELTIGVGQVNFMDEEELGEIKVFVEPHLSEVLADYKLDMLYLMMTNITNETTLLLCNGKGSKDQAIEAFKLPEDSCDLILKGVVSRKKQLIPTLVTSLQQ